MSARVFIVIIVMALPVVTYAQEDSIQTVYIKDAAFLALGDTVIISYEVVSESEVSFDVGVVLRKQDDPNFSLVVTTTLGDIGRIHGPGQKIILWSYRNDAPAGFQYGEDYWFEISLVPVPRGWRWWYYAAVAGGVAATTAAIIVLSGDNSSPENQGLGTLPDPPIVRPGN